VEQYILRAVSTLAISILAFVFCLSTQAGLGVALFIALLAFSCNLTGLFRSTANLGVFMLGIWAGSVLFLNAPTAKDVLSRFKEVSAGKETAEARETLSNAVQKVQTLSPGASTASSGSEGGVAPVSATQAELELPAETTLQSLKRLEEVCASGVLDAAACDAGRAKLLAAN
jgi:hypothetical protein